MSKVADTFRWLLVFIETPELNSTTQFSTQFASDSEKLGPVPEGWLAL